MKKMKTKVKETTEYATHDQSIYVNHHVINDRLIATHYSCGQVWGQWLINLFQFDSGKNSNSRDLYVGRGRWAELRGLGACRLLHLSVSPKKYIISLHFVHWTAIHKNKQLNLSSVTSRSEATNFATKTTRNAAAAAAGSPLPTKQNFTDLHS